MSDRGQFDFFDEWRLAAESDEVWAVVRDVESWPEWWPFVLSVTPMTGRTSPTWEFRFRTRLPYDMVFVVELLRDDPQVGVEARVAAGTVQGSGRWRVVAIEGGTLVHFDFSVRPQLAWMRAVAPVARPVFSWNHRSVMAGGATALARRLATRLLADPAGALLPARRGSRPT